MLAVLALALPLHAAEQGAKVAKIDINKASAVELAKLPRVGPALAQRIIEYREQNGGFRKVDDLMSVKGIGQKTFEQMKDQVTVGTAEPGK